MCLWHYFGVNGFEVKQAESSRESLLVPAHNTLWIGKFKTWKNPVFEWLVIHVANKAQLCYYLFCIKNIENRVLGSQGFYIFI